MTLLQVAYSHNRLAAKFDDSHDGFFRSVEAHRRITVPLVITYTKNGSDSPSASGPLP
jgi:hypothetical protein